MTVSVGCIGTCVGFAGVGAIGVLVGSNLPGVGVDWNCGIGLDVSLCACAWCAPTNTSRDARIIQSKRIIITPYGVGVRVGVRVLVRVGHGVRLIVGVRVAFGVSVGGAGVCVGLGVNVWVGVRVWYALVHVGLGVRVCVYVGVFVNVSVGPPGVLVAVRVADRVRVGVLV